MTRPSPLSALPFSRFTSYPSLLAALGILVGSGAGWSQNQIRENRPREYRVFASEHFDIHYDADDLRPRAAEAAAWLENVRTRLGNELGRVPLRRVPVFLYRDHDDFEQTTVGGGFIPEKVGAFTEVSKDRIVLPLYPSLRFQQRVLEHEYVHVLQFHHFFRTRFPSFWLIAFPLYPDWFMEGGANYHARFWDTRLDLRIRDRVLEDGLRTLPELAGFSHLNPGEVAEGYHLGALAHAFLAEKAGPDAPRRLFDVFAERFPFAPTYILRQAVGMDLRTLDREFRVWVRERALRGLEGRRDAGAFATPVTRPFGYYRREDWSPAVGPDGRIAFLSDRRDLASLNVIRPDGSGRRDLLRGRLNVGIENLAEGDAALAWDPRGGRIAAIGERGNRRDLLLVTTGFFPGVESVPLPFDEAFSPSFSPDGTKIVLSGQMLGLTDLYVLDPAARTIERLTEDPHHDHSPRWSPDGKSIVYVSEREGQTDLVRLDVATKQARPLTNTWSDETAPAWSPDGKWIAYAADPGGFHDLFAMEAATGKTYRLTRVRGGCFSPAWAPDGKSIVFAYYRGGRHLLYRMPADPAAWEPETAGPDDERKALHRYDELFRRPIDPVSERPYATDFSPDIALPLVVANLFSASDMTGEHQFDLIATAAATDDHVVAEGDFVYRYTGLRPDLGVDVFEHVSREADPDRDRITYGGLAFASYPFSQYLAGHLTYTAFQETEDFEHGTSDHDFITGPVAALSWSNVVVRGIDPVRGTAVTAGARYFDDDLGSDETATEYFARGEAYRTIYPDHVIALAAAWDKSTGPDRDDFDLSRSPGGGLGVRGYGFGDVEGTSRFLAKAEYRFPIWRDLNLVFPYQLLLLKDIRGFAFGDFGTATHKDLGRLLGDLNDEEWRHSLGAGIRFDFYLLERLPMPVAVQVAKVTDHDEDLELLITVGFDLLGTGSGSPARPALPSKLLR